MLGSQKYALLGTISACVAIASVIAGYVLTVSASGAPTRVASLAGWAFYITFGSVVLAYLFGLFSLSHSRAEAGRRKVELKDVGLKDVAGFVFAPVNRVAIFGPIVVVSEMMLTVWFFQQHLMNQFLLGNIGFAVLTMSLMGYFVAGCSSKLSRT